MIKKAYGLILHVSYYDLQERTYMSLYVFQRSAKFDHANVNLYLYLKNERKLYYPNLLFNIHNLNIGCTRNLMTCFTMFYKETAFSNVKEYTVMCSIAHVSLCAIA